jgi:two-component system chemotaxis response regulator CheB
MKRDIVVIGASAGGIDALKTIVKDLPRDFPASIFVVVHVSADAPGVLASILSRAGNLPAITVSGSERTRPGTIYVPRLDHHLVIEPSVVCATRGPKENRFRPAVDPLFRSAAQTYGPRAIGVVLTGGLDDGTAGLWTIKQLGGVAIVQDPADALAESMPRNALEYVNVDHCVPVSQIASLLVRLTDEDIAEQGGYTVPKHVEIEVKIAKENQALDAGVESLGEPSTYACPECHGVLLQLKEGGRVRFRCHTGHAYSAESLIADFDDAIEDALWNSVRALQEKAIFLRNFAEHVRATHSGAEADALMRSAQEAHERSEMVRRAALNRSADDKAA